jgi:hypothetical protein
MRCHGSWQHHLLNKSAQMIKTIQWVLINERFCSLIRSVHISKVSMSRNAHWLAMLIIKEVHIKVASYIYNAAHMANGSLFPRIKFSTLLKTSSSEVASSISHCLNPHHHTCLPTWILPGFPTINQPTRPIVWSTIRCQSVRSSGFGL